jgi:uncharacterized protein YjbI with pentapeptide repeats
MDLVTLKCVKENNRLRIKIVSPGYIQSANCMFPKNIRVENQHYTVPKSDVIMTDTKGKFFYRIKKNNIVIVNDSTNNLNNSNFDNLFVYGDDDTECAICLERKTNIIFVSCGHYCCCDFCGAQLKNCCMCRAPIKQLITKDQLQ